MALHEEFRRRATALIESTINSHEIQLSDHVTRLAHGSEEALSNITQRVQNTGPPDHRAENPISIPAPFQSSFPDDCASRSQVNLEDNWMDWTLPSSNSNFDAFLDSAVNVHYEAGDIFQCSGDSSSSSLGRLSTDSCSCTGEYNYQTTPPHQMGLSATPAQPQTDTSLPKDEVIMNILLSLSRSMLTLEERLDAK